MNPMESAIAIPREEWAAFLQSFSQEYRHWPVKLETHDRGTGEIVVSHTTPLRSIEFDLEDEKNPRINVIVELDNKVIKHILYQPSHLILHPSDSGARTALRIDSVNTATTVHVGVPQRT